MDELRNRIKYFKFERGYWRNDLYVVAFDGDTIVGILDYAYCTEPTFQGHLHFLSYVSIDPVYQNRGIATKLIQYWVETVLKVDLGVCGCSGFTESGFNYLIPIFDKLEIDIEFERKISF